MKFVNGQVTFQSQISLLEENYPIISVIFKITYPHHFSNMATLGDSTGILKRSANY